jgi:hypothetical protein
MSFFFNPKFSFLKDEVLDGKLSVSVTNDIKMSNKKAHGDKYV